MKLLKFIETVSLYEAAKDRYMQAFSRLAPIYQSMDKQQEFDTWVNDNIRWAMNVLKKDDKIQWFLRYLKLDMLHDLVTSSDEEISQNEQIIRDYKKLLSNMVKKSNRQEQAILEEAKKVATNPAIKRGIEHYMSLGLAPIENTVFTFQSPDEIFDAWRPVERAWQEQASQLVDIDYEDVETVIKFPDGSEWINLNQPYCDAEAAAMGHCGNRASYSQEDTILSYRTIEKTDRGQMWKPRLTFVLNTDTRLLGEMKGRANQKPDSKYHGVIIELLKQDIIKGIKGGGYDPENNFSMEDLPDEVSEKLIDEKPALGSIKYDYKKRGVTRDLLNRIEDTLNDINEDMPEYDPAHKLFVIKTEHTDPYEFFKEYGGRDAEWIVDILTGEEHLDLYGGYSLDHLWNDDVPDDISTKAGEWLLENYENQIEEWKEENDRPFDPTDKSNVWSFADEYQVDEIIDAMQRATEDAHRAGIEGKMFQHVEHWFNDIETDYDISVTVPMTFDDRNVQVLIPEGDFMMLISDEIDDIEYYNDIVDSLQIKEFSYRDNYDDFDFDIFKQSIVDALRETGVLQ